MKILFLTPNFEGYIGVNKWYFTEALKREADVTCIGKYYPDYKPGMTLQDAMTDGTPDVICYWQCATTPTGKFEGLAESRIPKVAFMHDGHNYRDAQISNVNRLGMDLALFPSWTEYLFYYLERVQCPMVFHPCSIEENVYKDYRLPKTVDVMKAGMYGKFYPLRDYISLKMKEWSRTTKLRIVNLPHFGYNYDTLTRYESELKPKGYLWREDYAMALNKSKTFMFDGGKYRSAVNKYFEGMACKTLVMAPLPFMSWKYGFKKDQHLVHITRFNLERKLQYYLEHEDERRKIIDAAYIHVMKYHSNTVRVQETLQLFDKLLDGAVFPPPLQFN